MCLIAEGVRIIGNRWKRCFHVYDNSGMMLSMLVNQALMAGKIAEQ